MKKYTILYLIILLLFSCNKNQESTQNIGLKNTTTLNQPIEQPVGGDYPIDIRIFDKSKMTETSNLMKQTNCSNGKNTLPNMNINIPDGFKYGMVTIQTKTPEGWTYWNWIAYNIPFGNHEFIKGQDEFPNGTLQAINSSGLKKFYLQCPKKGEKYEYIFRICGYSKPIPALDDNIKGDDTIKHLNIQCKESGSTTYYGF